MLTIGMGEEWRQRDGVCFHCHVPQEMKLRYSSNVDLGL